MERWKKWRDEEEQRRVEIEKRRERRIDGMKEKNNMCKGGRRGGKRRDEKIEEMES